MIPRASLTGLILAGGQSRRMQALGQADTPTAGASEVPARRMNVSTEDLDKGLLALHGKPLVAHAHDFLAPHVESVLISANRHLKLYQEYGQVVADLGEPGTYLGPLAGIARALACAGTPWVIVIPVDVINLPDDLVSRLCVAVQRNSALLAYASTEDPGQTASSTLDLAQPGGAGRVQPLCMIAHVRLAAELHAYLMAGGRKVQLWQQRCGAVPVFFEGNDDAFTNINTPQHLQRAAGLP